LYDKNKLKWIYFYPVALNNFVDSYREYYLKYPENFQINFIFELIEYLTEALNEIEVYYEKYEFSRINLIEYFCKILTSKANLYKIIDKELILYNKEVIKLEEKAYNEIKIYFAINNIIFFDTYCIVLNNLATSYYIIDKKELAIDILQNKLIPEIKKIYDNFYNKLKIIDIYIVSFNNLISFYKKSNNNELMGKAIDLQKEIFKEIEFFYKKYKNDFIFYYCNITNGLSDSYFYIRKNLTKALEYQERAYIESNKI